MDDISTPHSSIQKHASPVVHTYEQFPGPFTLSKLSHANYKNSQHGQMISQTGTLTLQVGRQDPRGSGS